MENCIVTRAFRGASLFLVAAPLHGFQWSADRSQAMRLPSGAALDMARAASEFDPREAPAVALDPLGQVLAPRKAPPRASLRKAVGYAYATSARAAELGCEKEGCFYVEQSMLREDGTWSPGFIAQGCHDSFASLTDPDLVALYREADGVMCPYFARSERGRAFRLLLDREGA